MAKPDTLKQYLPASSRSLHGAWTEIGALHSELKHLQECMDKLQDDMASFEAKTAYMLWESQRKEGESTLEAKQRFFRNLPGATGLTALRQRATLKLFGEFVEFCRKNDISYWIAQGSLLGAVRHGGFIPWDDDLDVGMTRQELTRAIELLQSNSDFRITVVFDYCVKCRQVRFRYTDEKIPVFVDIFIFDPVAQADGVTFQKRESARKHLYDQLKQNEGLSFWNRENQFVQAGSSLAAPIENIFDYALNTLYGDGTLVESLDDADGVIWAIDNVDSGVKNHGWYLIGKETLLPFSSVEFAGLSVPAPHDPMAFLESYFGDIYALPHEFGTYYNHAAGENQSEVELRRVLLELLGDTE